MSNFVKIKKMGAVFCLLSQDYGSNQELAKSWKVEWQKLLSVFSENYQV